MENGRINDFLLKVSVRLENNNFEGLNRIYIRKLSLSKILHSRMKGFH